MKLITLGTSGAMPTLKRSLSSTVLVLDKEYVMVDCGEGTQFRFMQAGLKWNKPLTILITHLHSDHILGIVGLLQSMDLMGRKAPVNIFGMKGIEAFIRDVGKHTSIKFDYDFKVVDLEAGDTVSFSNDWKADTCQTVHQVPSIAFRIVLPDKEGKLDIEKCKELGIPDNSAALGQLKSGNDVQITTVNGEVKLVKSSDVVGPKQKGKIISFSGDTRPTELLKLFYTDSDYLVHEATFLQDEKDLAIKAKHSTALEAAYIGLRAGVGHTILNHFSARHPSGQVFYDEASKVNRNIIVARDLMEIEL